MSTSWLEHANDWLARQLGASTGPTAFGLLLVGGLLASLLPCVYPLYPITASILSQRQSRLGKLAHPLAYYAGLVATYFVFGIVAALLGGSFNDILRQPGVNLGIGALLLLLAVATAGLLHFPALSGVGSEQGSSLASTFVMGAGAGLLSSVCVGPVVVSILVSMASATTGVSAGTALLGATKMMVFGMGVGLPLLLVGLFGIALPKSGQWMVYVQSAFGVLIAWFAVGYVFKGLSGLGFSESARWAVVVGAGLVLMAAWLFQGEEVATEQRTKRAVLVLTGVIGFFVVGRGLLDSTLARAMPVGVAAEAQVEKHGNLAWHLDKKAAYEEAAQKGKLVFVDFHGDWCTNCKAFQELTLSDPKLNAALGRAVLLKVRDTTTLFEEYKDDPRFPELKVGLPFFVVTDAKGTLLYKTSDYTRSREMALFLSD
jgi:thioredoxin:protein disulfide reductase